MDNNQTEYMHYLIVSVHVWHNGIHVHLVLGGDTKVTRGIRTPSVVDGFSWTITLCTLWQRIKHDITSGLRTHLGPWIQSQACLWRSRGTLHAQVTRCQWTPPGRQYAITTSEMTLVDERWTWR